jgi:hypothetical protein
MRLSLAPATTLSVVLVLFPSAQGQIVQGIGVLPGHLESRSECISADGAVAGGVSTGIPADAVRWNGSLGALPAPVAHGGMVTQGLNGFGDAAAGLLIDGIGDSYAWRWDPIGGTQLLPWPLGALACFGNDIDVAGTVVVGTAEMGGFTRALRWTQSGPVFLAQILGGMPASVPWSEAIAVSNDGGFVAGTLEPSLPAVGIRAFRWEAASSITYTSPFLPGGTWASALGISGDGLHVVGTADAPTGNRAFRWTIDGNLMLDLATVPGHTVSAAYDASQDGSIVVGYSAAPPLVPSVATLWTSALGMVDLNVYLPGIGVDCTNWVLRNCSGISDDGRSLTGTGAHQHAPNQWRTEGWILHVPHAPWVGPPVVTSCPASPNSLGLAAVLNGAGTTSVASNDFVLTTSGGIPSNFHLYFYGPETTQQPFGDGTRCVGPGPLGLFRLLPPELYSADGVASRWLDLTAAPAASGPGRIAPGSIWYFQDWYRDPHLPGGFGFNFSSAIQVSFGP